MSYTRLLTVIWILALLLVANSIFAEVPQMINYQGRLTETDGTPVDGAQLIKFKIYGSVSGTDSLWWSGFQTVQVDQGFFEYKLGSIVQLPDGLFETDTIRYLGITVGTDPEIDPRTQLITTPYSYQALRSDSADYSTTAASATSADDALALDGNPPSYYLDWSNLTGIPADIADGDDVGAGDITAVNPGTGLSGGGVSGSVTLYVTPDGITSDLIASNAVHSEEIADGTIIGADIATGAVNSSDIADNSIGQIDIADDAVGVSEIADNAVGSGEIINNSIIADDIAADGVGSAEIAAGSVNSAEIADLAIVNADINNSANISVSKISGTAVNLSSAQTISADKTFNGTVYFGDSTLRINNNGINIGDAYGPYANYLIRSSRNYNTTISRYSHYVDLENSSYGNLYGIFGNIEHTTEGTAGSAYGTHWYVSSDGDYRALFYGTVEAADITITTGTSYGLRAIAYDGEYAYGAYLWASSATNDYGIYASCGSASGDYGGYFYGNLHSTGSNTKGAGGIKIDHPLDPENQYLIHSDVESPEMMNIYNGNVTTDGEGEATVILPDYFEALNVDYRYQLTVMNTFAQAIVAEKINNNRFVIKTDKPYIEVSWQVAGIRNDAYAKSNRLPVEIDKPAEERGLYMHPTAFGLEENMQIHYEQNKEAIERTMGSEE